jgi:selenoprotein W-related protein
LADELLKSFTPFIETLTLIPSSGGRFEVTVGETLIYSKKATGRHVQPGEIAQLLERTFGVKPIPVE